MFWLLLFFLSLIDLVALISAESWERSGKIIFLFGTSLFFALAGLLFAFTLRWQKGMGITNIIWVGFSAVFALLAGWIFFQERISFIQAVGVFFVILGLLFLNLKFNF